MVTSFLNKQVEIVQKSGTSNKNKHDVSVVPDFGSNPNLYWLGQLGQET